MNAPRAFRNRSMRSEREEARQDWIDERRREARIVVADVLHHSDHMLRVACNVLVRHGESDEEREDARILLVVLDAKSPTQRTDLRDEPEKRR